jgi:hypothetical protein
MCEGPQSPRNLTGEKTSSRRLGNSQVPPDVTFLAATIRSPPFSRSGASIATRSFRAHHVRKQQSRQMRPSCLTYRVRYAGKSYLMKATVDDR